MGRPSDTVWKVPDRLLAPLQRLRLEEDLAVSFFFAFSRFEFALKQVGCLRFETPGSDALPDWPKFGKRIEAQYDPKRNPNLSEAVNYLLRRAPKKQVVHPGPTLGWKDTPVGREDIGWVLTLVARVRNNLFHGGKYTGSPNELAHDTRLLQNSLIILDACLDWDDEVRAWYLS